MDKVLIWDRCTDIQTNLETRHNTLIQLPQEISKTVLTKSSCNIAEEERTCPPMWQQSQCSRTLEQEMLTFTFCKTTGLSAPSNIWKRWLAGFNAGLQHSSHIPAACCSCFATSTILVSAIPDFFSTYSHLQHANVTFATLPFATVKRKGMQ